MTDNTSEGSTLAYNVQSLRPVENPRASMLNATAAKTIAARDNANGWGWGRLRISRRIPRNDELRNRHKFARARPGTKWVVTMSGKWRRPLPLKAATTSTHRSTPPGMPSIPGTSSAGEEDKPRPLKGSLAAPKSTQNSSPSRGNGSKSASNSATSANKKATHKPTKAPSVQSHSRRRGASSKRSKSSHKTSRSHNQHSLLQSQSEKSKSEIVEDKTRPQYSVDHGVQLSQVPLTSSSDVHLMNNDPVPGSFVNMNIPESKKQQLPNESSKVVTGRYKGPRQSIANLVRQRIGVGAVIKNWPPVRFSVVRTPFTENKMNFGSPRNVAIPEFEQPILIPRPKPSEEIGETGGKLVDRWVKLWNKKVDEVEKESATKV